jgi:hypothetical protein
VFVCPKSPLVEMRSMNSLSVPSLVTFTTRGWLLEPMASSPNESLFTLALNAGNPPMPERASSCVPALSLIVTVPLRTPSASGPKVTKMVQLPPAGTEEPQVFVCEYDLLAKISETRSFTAPRFVNVADRAMPVVWIRWVRKLSEVGSSPTDSLTPVPDRDAVCVPLEASSWTVSLPVRNPSASAWKVTEIVHASPAPKDDPQ